MPNNYWAKKLGPPPAPPPAPPQPRYGPDVLPRGMGSDPQSVQRAVNHYVSTLPGQQFSPQVAAPIQQPQPQWQPKSPAENPTNVADVLPIWQWQGDQRGGAGETVRTGACPACHSNNYFSRSSGSVINVNSGQSAAPAPECFDCGYPREQGGLGSAHVEGPAMAARQGATPNTLGISKLSQPV